MLQHSGSAAACSAFRCSRLLAAVCLLDAPLSKKHKVLGRQVLTDDDSFNELIRRSVVMIQDVVQQQGGSHVDDVPDSNEIVAMTVEPEIASAPVNHWPDHASWIVLLIGFADLAIVPAPRAIGQHPLRFIRYHEPIYTLIRCVTGRWHPVAEPANRTENGAGRQDTAPEFSTPENRQRKPIGSWGMSRGELLQVGNEHGLKCSVSIPLTLRITAWH